MPEIRIEVLKMFKIYDGRNMFYQWDLDRKLIIEDATIDEVHFYNNTEECALVLQPYVENGVTLVNVPNILLTSENNVIVWASAKDHTIAKERFKVEPRQKPADYIYTETEIYNVEVNIQEKVQTYFNEHKDDLKGKNGADGYTPIKGVDYFDGADGLSAEIPKIVGGLNYGLSDSKTINIRPNTIMIVKAMEGNTLCCKNSKTGQTVFTGVTLAAVITTDKNLAGNFNYFMAKMQKPSLTTITSFYDMYTDSDDGSLYFYTTSTDANHMYIYYDDRPIANIVTPNKCVYSAGNYWGQFGFKLPNLQANHTYELSFYASINSNNSIVNAIKGIRAYSNKGSGVGFDSTVIDYVDNFDTNTKKFTANFTVTADNNYIFMLRQLNDTIFTAFELYDITQDKIKKNNLLVYDPTNLNGWASVWTEAPNGATSHKTSSNNENYVELSLVDFIASDFSM